MKKLLLIMFFVSIVSIGYLNSIQILTNNWDRAPGYPLYKQVEKREISEFNKTSDIRKTRYFKVSNDDKYQHTTERRINPQTGFKENYVTLTDESGAVLWTMKERNELGWDRKFFTSSKGITAIYQYDIANSLVWIDNKGNVLNRMELQEMQTVRPVNLKNGEIWLIQTEYDAVNYGVIDDVPNLTSLIFCDGNGNMLNEIDLKHTNLIDEMALSKNNNYIMYSCYSDMHNPKTKTQYQSLLIKFDGTIIREYDKALGRGGDFSEKGDIYVNGGSRSYVIDVSTGKFLASYRAHSRSAVANKGTGIVAVLDFYDLRVINYKTKKLLFHKKFDVYPEPKYLEITGDAKEVIVVTKDHLYTFRMKE